MSSRLRWLLGFDLWARHSDPGGLSQPPFLLSATPERGGAPSVPDPRWSVTGHKSSKRAHSGNVSATDAEAAKYPQHGAVGTYDGQ